MASKQLSQRLRNATKKPALQVSRSANFTKCPTNSMRRCRSTRGSSWPNISQEARVNRRDLLKSAVLAPLACSAQSKKPLDLSEFEPKSMLQVKETKVERARYPLIDIHTHLSWATKASKGVPLSEERRFIMEPAE